MNPHISNHTAAQTDRIISIFKELETLTLITPVVKNIILRFQIKKEKMQETGMEKCSTLGLTARPLIHGRKGIFCQGE